jgi:glycosyltransferase involved in cell wall biosynthesis
VIVVDDGSTDDTPELVRTSFGSCVRYVHQQNAGMGEARNRGHAEARGEFVAWLDADDIAEPERLRLQVDILLRHPEVGVVASAFSAFDESGSFSESFGERYYGLGSEALCAAFATKEEAVVAFRGADLKTSVHRGSVYPLLAYGNFVHPPTVMIRRELARRAGPLDSLYLGATDWEFLVRASRLAHFAHLDIPLLRYRRSGEQMTAEKHILRNVPREMLAFGKMLADDPQLGRERHRVRALYRDWHLSLAVASLANDRRGMFSHLARSLRYGVEPGPFARTAARAVLPHTLFRPLRTGWQYCRRALRRA